MTRLLVKSAHLSTNSPPPKAHSGSKLPVVILLTPAPFSWGSADGSPLCAALPTSTSNCVERFVLGVN
eukprot:363195-Chlamydomonas_euryale.AAC.1